MGSSAQAALAQSREGADRVVTEDHGGLREIDLEGGRLLGEDAREGLATDLMAHVVRRRVGEGADDDFALPVGPPTQNHTPAEERGVPCDDNDVGQAGLPGEECSV